MFDRHSDWKLRSLWELIKETELGAPAAFLDAFARLTVIADAEERAGVGAAQLKRLKNCGPHGAINREYRLRRLAGEKLPRRADFRRAADGGDGGGALSF